MDETRADLKFRSLVRNLSGYLDCSRHRLAHLIYGRGVHVRKAYEYKIGVVWNMQTPNPLAVHVVNDYLHVHRLYPDAKCGNKLSLLCFHVVEQRLARWLLMTADRVHAPTFRITHEFLSHMLGVRRERITQSASALQRRKLITHTRGRVVILAREGLERASCACYQSDLSAYREVFG